MPSEASLLAAVRHLGDSLADLEAAGETAAVGDFLAPGELAQLTDAVERCRRLLARAARASGFSIRPIVPDDDPAVARIIREVMTEFGAVGEGYSIEDPEVDAMSAAYAGPRAAFWVVTRDDVPLGCGGVAPLAGADPGVCELRKMYFLPELRGAGLGVPLLHLCLRRARELGFRTCYLETLGRMRQARVLYRRFGFEDLDGPIGATGHHGCNSWMAVDLASLDDALLAPSIAT